MDRRKLFGFASGAAVAVPDIAKQLVGNGLNAPTPYYGGAHIGTAVGHAEDPTWASRHLADLVKRRALIGTENQAHGLRNNEQAIAERYAALRSIAIGPRRAMFERERARMQAEQQLEWIDKEIAELKQRMGPIGALLGAVA